jgi:hypothetical protein
LVFGILVIVSPSAAKYKGVIDPYSPAPISMGATEFAMASSIDSLSYVKDRKNNLPKKSLL